MMQFPVILKLSGQDELLYAADKHSLAQHYQLQSAYLLPDDIVIDSTGNAYPLQSLYANNLPQQASQQFSLAEVTAPRPKRKSATGEASNFSGSNWYVTRLTLASIGRDRQTCGL